MMRCCSILDSLLKLRHALVSEPAAEAMVEVGDYHRKFGRVRQAARWWIGAAHKGAKIEAEAMLLSTLLHPSWHADQIPLRPYRFAVVVYSPPEHPIKDIFTLQVRAAESRRIFGAVRTARRMSPSRRVPEWPALTTCACGAL